MNHTPGPWEVRKTFYGETYIEGKDGDFVCAFPECSPNKKDVVMIAATPEMYELLDDAMTELASIVNNYELTEEDTRDAIAVCKKFDALWRRIKGEEETE